MEKLKDHLKSLAIAVALTIIIMGILLVIIGCITYMLNIISGNSVNFWQAYSFWFIFVVIALALDYFVVRN